MDLIWLENVNGGGDVEAGVTPKTAIEEEKLYVAVGKEVRESESLLLWAIKNSGGRKISIIHVHQPDDFIPILGKKYHWSSLEEQQIRAYRGVERQLMIKSLDEYLHICRQFGVQAEKIYIEMDSIEKGLLQLIAQHNIEKLVMGAASSDGYNKKMTELKSKKAVYLQRNAPASCHIWFICNGHLIHHREGGSQVKVYAENERSFSRSLSNMGQSSTSNISSQVLLHREGSSHFGPGNGRVTSSMCSTENAHVSRSQLDLEANDRDWYETVGFIRSQGSDVSIGSSSHSSTGLTADLLELHAASCSNHCQNRHLLSPLPISPAKSSEIVYVEEVRKRKELEEELKQVKNDRDRLHEELQAAMAWNSEQEGKVSNYDQVVKDLEEGMQLLRKERDDLKTERDNVLKTAEDLLNQSTDAPRLFATLTFAEIQEATNDFDLSLLLSEGANGSIYKGVISHTQVILKIRPSEGLQGPREFHQEVEVLSKFRHPNVVTLMGVSLEAWAVVYEYLPNGTLQEWLNCTHNTPPLSWQTRIKIATDLCTALIFLHSRVPQRVVHGALEPSSLLLDSNFTCKISDFGFSHILPCHENTVSTQLSYSSTYMDPLFFMSGEVSPSMDVYSFGMILLELLTGKPAFGLTDELEDAVKQNNFDSLLDASAGAWPYVQAEQLAQLALRCCAENASNRPDLESDVWRVLEPMRAFCGGSTSYHLGDEEHRPAPSYFICPILTEVMKDPHVAADGFTYEAEALRGWLDSGHDTSPMTNLQLEHCNLVPNRALRSAIQEWSLRH